MRQLLRQPGFAAVAVLTLALGIGATTAIFSLVWAVVLAPLPYEEPDRLVRVWEVTPRGADRNVGRSQDPPAVGDPGEAPLFRPEPDRSWGPEAYLGSGAALGLVLMLVLGLGLGLGPIELVLLAPVAVLATVWLAIGVIAKGVEVGRRASRSR